MSELLQYPCKPRDLVVPGAILTPDYLQFKDNSARGIIGGIIAKPSPALLALFSQPLSTAREDRDKMSTSTYEHFHGRDTLKVNSDPALVFFKDMFDSGDTSPESKASAVKTSLGEVYENLLKLNNFFRRYYLVTTEDLKKLREANDSAMRFEPYIGANVVLSTRPIDVIPRVGFSHGELCDRQDYSSGGLNIRPNGDIRFTDMNQFFDSVITFAFETEAAQLIQMLISDSK